MKLLRNLRGLWRSMTMSSEQFDDLVEAIAINGDREKWLMTELLAGDINIELYVQEVLGARRQRVVYLRAIGWHGSADQLEADTEMRERWRE